MFFRGIWKTYSREFYIALDLGISANFSLRKTHLNTL